MPRYPLRPVFLSPNLFALWISSISCQQDRVCITQQVCNTYFFFSCKKKHQPIKIDQSIVGRHCVVVVVDFSHVSEALVISQTLKALSNVLKDIQLDSLIRDYEPIISVCFYRNMLWHQSKVLFADYNLAYHRHDLSCLLIKLPLPLLIDVIYAWQNT